jgi:hypothetical protein
MYLLVNGGVQKVTYDLTDERTTWVFDCSLVPLWCPEHGSCWSYIMSWNMVV